MNPRHFLVGADGGRVLKGSWVGAAPPPKQYVPHDHGSAATLEGMGRARVPSLVTALHVSPSCPWAFLAGHDDGTVTLHGLAMQTAAASWPGVAAGGVRALRWSPARPCVFFVLDAMCMLSCFDLSKNRQGRRCIDSLLFLLTKQNIPFGFTTVCTPFSRPPVALSGQLLCTRNRS